MTCEEFRERLSELIDRTLSEEQEARMYKHAETCGDCEELLRQTMRLVAELNALPSSVSVPLAAQTAWRCAVREEGRPVLRVRISRFSRAVAGVAAALLILCGATFMTRLPQAAQPVVLNDVHELASAYDRSQDEMEYAAPQGDVTAYGTQTGTQRVYGRMSDGALKKEDTGTQTPLATGTADTSEVTAQKQELRLARSAQLQIETNDFESDCEMLENIVLSNEGYFELREKQGESEPSLHAVVRVPAEGLNDFLSQMEMIGQTVKRVERAQDLSADFRDVEERLNACQSKLQKLYELQDSCQDVNDLVTIAQTISDDIAESERLQGNRAELNSQMNYATVAIDLAGHIDADESEQDTSDMAGKSVGERMKSGFAGSVEWLKSFCTDALVLLVSSLPRLVVAIPALALVILLIVWIARRKHR